MDNCFFNGKLLPFEDVTININELGLLRAYAVFDYLRTYRGSPFRIDDYLARFKNSAAQLHLPLKFSEDEIKAAIHKLLEGKAQDMGIRLLLTGGYTGDSMTVREPNFFILCEKIQDYPGQIFTKGVKLMTCNFQRFMPQVKTTNYLNAILLKPNREKEKAFEVLYHRNGEITETARNNFFLVKNKILITPAENILLGITRKVILELAMKIKGTKKLNGIKEGKIHLPGLSDSEEAFITGSSKGIVPVVQVDNQKIGDGKVGPVTKELMELFDSYVKTGQ